jgi:hypothetical protein
LTKHIKAELLNEQHTSISDIPETTEPKSEYWLNPRVRRMYIWLESFTLFLFYMGYTKSLGSTAFLGFDPIADMNIRVSTSFSMQNNSACIQVNAGDRVCKALQMNDFSCSPVGVRIGTTLLLFTMILLACSIWLNVVNLVAKRRRNVKFLENLSLAVLKVSLFSAVFLPLISGFLLIGLCSFLQDTQRYSRSFGNHPNAFDVSSFTSFYADWGALGFWVGVMQSTSRFLLTLHFSSRSPKVKFLS